MLAMQRAVTALRVTPAHALIDGKHCPKQLPCPATAIVDGDALSLSIAAASIVAKVVRDRMCEIMDCDAPHFGFAGHKGYGTRSHVAALNSLGPSPLHRRSFAPVRISDAFGDAGFLQD